MYRTVLALAVIIILLYLYHLRRHRPPLPPGPQTSCFRSLAIPTSSPWLTYAKWSQRYNSDIIYLRIFGNPILILNSASAASDLLEKRSRYYSSRPVRTMVVELMGWDWLFSSMPYGQYWMDHRYLFQKYFPPQGNPEYRHIMARETRTLLRNLLQSPENFRHHLRRTSAAVILEITYGIKIDDAVAENGDNYVTLADRALAGLATAGIYGTFLVDYLPALKYIPIWMPGTSFQKLAAKWKILSREMLERPFRIARERMTRENVPPCIVAQELENTDPIQLRETEIVLRNTAATTYAAGSDTTVSATLSLFLAMAIYPEVQDKAQAELDRVLNGRLPEFKDRPGLPYINALCYELLRWNPVTPLGLTHVNEIDDEYKGYRIPRGTTVVPNVWALLHDPAVYPDPFTFSPDRFLDSQSNAEPGLNEIPFAAFGFGRRMCPGRWFALDSLFIVVASTLSVFRISKAIDEAGEVITPLVEFTGGLLSHPKPFLCSITPRSALAEKTIKATLDQDL